MATELGIPFNLNSPLGPAAQPLDFSGENNLGIFARDTVQRFRLGTRFITWDGRVYKHSLAKGTLNADLGAKSYATQNLAFAAVVAAQVAGDKQISVTFGAADGYANSGLVAKDELAGGYVVVFSDTVATMVRGIVGNSAVATGGGTGILYVDMPWNVAIATADSYAEAIGSPFYDVRNDSDGTKTVIGMPVCHAVANEYCWLQTWGITWIAPQSGVGNSIYVRSGYFRHDGSIDVRSNVGTNVTDQRAGFCIQNAQAGTQGAPFFMLQISI